MIDPEIGEINHSLINDDNDMKRAQLGPFHIVRPTSTLACFYSPPAGVERGRR
ncbi:hypothetical protein [Sphingomonas sp. UYP23]